MTADSKHGFPPILRTALLLVISLSIFGWGTAYRLSLYQPSSQQNLAQQAKLEARAGESNRSATNVCLHPPAQPEPPLLPPVPAAWSAGFPAAAGEKPDSRELSHLFAAALFLRPPPALQLA